MRLGDSLSFPIAMEICKRGLGMWAGDVDYGELNRQAAKVAKAGEMEGRGNQDGRGWGTGELDGDLRFKI